MCCKRNIYPMGREKNLSVCNQTGTRADKSVKGHWIYINRRYKPSVTSKQKKTRSN